MGRRSINSTKSGKFMNPTDQARKEARRKELKRNKRQRMAVRHAVLKNKDPKEIIKELDKIDKMEYSVDAAPPLSEKVLMEKRRKLKETLDRVLKLYEKEDPDYWAEIRRTEAEYEKKRIHLITYYESVKHAQEVTVDDIPLPQNMLPETAPAQIPLPPGLDDAFLPTSGGILKKSVQNVDSDSADSLFGPPGIPPGIPPELELPEDELAAPKTNILPTAALSDSITNKKITLPDDPIQQHIAPPAPMMIQPPPMHHHMQSPLTAICLPPGPPPGLPPGIRMPPAPPAMLRIPPLSGPMHGMSNAVMSAAPQLRDPRQQSVTIEAKPQIRSLSADVTRFVPSALRVRRNGAQKLTEKKQTQNKAEAMPQQKPTKDDAYAMFMTEMKDLL